MSLALYMVEHVPSEITRGVRDRGVDVLTAQDDRRTGADDTALVDRATELRRVVFSCDSDMLREAAQRQNARKTFSGVIYIHPRNLDIGRCIADLELVAMALDPHEMQDAVLHLPLR